MNDSTKETLTRSEPTKVFRGVTTPNGTYIPVVVREDTETGNNQPT